MTSLDDIALPRPAATPDAGPARPRASTTSSRYAPAASSATTRSSRRISASTPRTSAWATAAATRSSRSSPTSARISPQVEALDDGGPLAGRPVRAGPRDPQHELSVFETGELRIWERRATGARCRRRRAVPAVRPRPRAAGRAARARSPRGSRRCPPSSRSRSPAPSGPRSAAGSSWSSTPCRRCPVAVRRDRGGGRGRPRAAPRRSGLGRRRRRRREGGRWRYGAWLRGDARRRRPTTWALGPRALRRVRRASARSTA